MTAPLGDRREENPSARGLQRFFGEILAWPWILQAGLLNIGELAGELDPARLAVGSFELSSDAERPVGSADDGLASLRPEFADVLVLCDAE